MQDDLARNFAMNPENGIVCSAFYRDEVRRRKKIESQGQARHFDGSPDNELVLLTRYMHICHIPCYFIIIRLTYMWQVVDIDGGHSGCEQAQPRAVVGRGQRVDCWRFEF
jgi:hypothetical protein